MYARGLKHFYIDEVCRLSDGQLVIPLAWIKRNGKLCADCWLVTTTIEVGNTLTDYGLLTNLILKGGWQFIDDAIHIVAADLFMNTYAEVVAGINGVIPWSRKKPRSLGFNVLTCLSS
jgi:hypothetical protein